MYRHISAYPVKGEAVFTYQINDEEKHTIEVRPYEKGGSTDKSYNDLFVG